MARVKPSSPCTDCKASQPRGRINSTTTISSAGSNRSSMLACSLRSSRSSASGVVMGAEPESGIDWAR
ncbi:hypothetical protein D3C80_1552180 [compost metagenome]